MRFDTQLGCEQWLAAANRQKSLGAHCQRIFYPPEPHRFLFMAQFITSISHRMPVLLWITEWGIWPTNGNWHLYYRLRQSYHDHRLLSEAPGHLFGGHESEDFGSFLQLALLSGWEGYIYTQANYVNAFFSHDEFIDFCADDDQNLVDIRKILGSTKTSP